MSRRIRDVRGILNFILCLVVMPVFSQTPPPQSTLFYNSGLVYIDTGVAVQITGNTEFAYLPTSDPNIPTSNFHNDGEVYVHFDTLFLGATEGFTIENQARVEGNGYYEVEPDWTNYSTLFIPDHSHVHLMSDVQQLITGSAPTKFNILELSGDGIGGDRKKRMTVNAFVLDSLSLRNRELATDSFVMTVQNTQFNAISRSQVSGDEGFVSSLAGATQDGFLARLTADNLNSYLFPVGSSVNPPSGKAYLYRPVDIRPDSAYRQTFSVRFTHESPDVAGFNQFSLDDSLCTVNPHYYHTINRTVGFYPARIRFYFDPLQDGIYDQAAQWSNSKWNLIGGTKFNDKNAFYQIIIPSTNVFSKDSLPFILADRIPRPCKIVGDPDICSGDLGMLRALGSSNFYDWQVPADVKVLSDPQDDSLIFKVNETGGYVHLSSTSSTGKCVQAADSFLIIVHPGPLANFTASKLSAFTNETIEFRDSSIGSPVEWFWKFGDGTSAFSPITTHKFKEVGEYLIEMYIQDENGCLDSTYSILEIIEGISVPNVFTPNGDGQNDLFYIPNSGMKEYQFQVFNRWGNILFETTAPEISWDGYNTYGKAVAEGTYFYILVARSDKNEYIKKGFLTLLR